MDTLGSRLKMLRNSKQLTQENLAKVLEVDRSTIGSWETNRREPDHNALQRIADFFDVTVDFLLGRTTSKGFAEEKTTFQYAKPRLTPGRTSEAKPVDLPIYGEIRRTNGGILFREYLGILPYYSKNLPFEDCYWLQVKGDSMYPRFFPGDYVLVHPQTDVDNGDIAVVLIGGEPGTIKRIQKSASGLILHSFNHRYKPCEAWKLSPETIYIAGKIIDMKPGKL